VKYFHYFFCSLLFSAGITAILELLPDYFFDFSPGIIYRNCIFLCAESVENQFCTSNRKEENINNIALVCLIPDNYTV